MKPRFVCEYKRYRPLDSNAFCNSSHLYIQQLCYVWIRPDLDVPRGGQKVESGGQLLTVLTRTRAGGTRTRTEETKMAGAEPEFPSVPKEPQRDTRRDK